MDCDSFEPEQRWGHRAVYLNDHVYLYGGCTPSLSKTHDGKNKLKAMSQIFLFDPSTCEWNMKVASGSPPLGIRDFAAVPQGRDRLIHFGGYCGHDYCWHNSLHTLYVNCDTPHWKMLTPNVSDRDCPMKKQDCGMVCYEDDNGSPTLCVFGGAGYKNNNHFSTDELHLMHLSEGKWIAPVVSGHHPPCCHGFTFVKIQNNQVVLFGGRIGKDDGPLSNQVYVLSLNDLSWIQLNPPGPVLPSCREGHASLASGKYLLVAGGLNKDEKALNDLWELDTITHTWKQIGQKIPSFVKQRACHSLTPCEYNDNGFVTTAVMFGGINKFIRGRTHNEQPMMSRTIIIKLNCNDETSTVDRCFDLTYMGMQAMTFARKYNNMLALRDKEVKELKQELKDNLSQLEKLEKSELESRQKLRQLNSQLSLDLVIAREPTPFSEILRSSSLPTGSTTGSKRSDSLTEVLDLRTVLEAIDELTEWQMLGTSLGLSRSTLDTIKEEQNGNVKMCKAKVIEHWLKRVDKVTEPTWISLVDAISGKLIKDNTLAEEIREKYITTHIIS